MKKGYPCLYTILLLITCLVASPLIFKQIWNNSKEVEPASSKKPPVIDISSTDDTENTSVAESTSEYTSDVSEIVSEQVTTEPPTKAFVKSDLSYFDDALFIGDSRTVGIYEYIDGYTIYDKLSSNSYGKIYVMLGINEVGNDFDYTMNSYIKLINAIKEYQPDSLIYIMGNLHVTQSRQSQGDTITNENINNLNSAMAELADGENVFYLDVNPIFDDSNGNLMSECSNDGVHVLAKYYQTWCDWLCLHTVPVQTSETEDTSITTETYTESSENYTDNAFYY